MMNDDPDMEHALKELHKSVQELREELLAPDADLEGRGVEAEEFLEQSAAFLKAMERDELEDFDLAGFIALIMEFHAETDAILDIQTAAEELATKAAQEAFFERVAEFGEKLEARSDAELRAAAEALRKQCGPASTETVPEEAAEQWTDSALDCAAAMAEARRRRAVYCALVCEWWKNRSLECQTEHGAGPLLDYWEEQRELILGELPLADVAMLESLDAADLGRPEIWRRCQDGEE